MEVRRCTSLGMEMHSTYPNSNWRRVKKTLLREMKDGMPIKERYNIIYSKGEIANPILFSISRGYFLEYGVEEYRQKCPDADTIFYRLKYAGIEDVSKHYLQTNERILSYAKKLEVFNKPLWMGLDFHNQPWHGKDDKYAVGADLRGTNWAHRIGTIEVVIPHKRFCLGCIPVYQLTSKAKAIRTLVEEERRWATIGRLFIDRAAFNVECLKVLEDLEVPYVIPAIRNKKVETIIREGRHLARWVPNSNSYAHIVDYEIGQKEKVKTKLVVIYTPPKDPKEKEDVFAFVTSLPVNLENCLEIAESYRKR